MTPQPDDHTSAHTGDRIGLQPASVGMHVLAALHDLPADEVARRGAARGLDLRTLSSYAEAPTPGEAIVIGYTHLPPEQIRSAVRTLARILTDRGSFQSSGG